MQCNLDNHYLMHTQLSKMVAEFSLLHSMSMDHQSNLCYIGNWQSESQRHNEHSNHIEQGYMQGHKYHPGIFLSYCSHYLTHIEVWDPLKRNKSCEFKRKIRLKHVTKHYLECIFHHTQQVFLVDIHMQHF